MKTIKIWDAWRVVYNGHEYICESPSEVWKLFGWDIENDISAKECSMMITAEIFAVGHIDLTQMSHGIPLTIEVIPHTGGDEA